MICVKTFNYHDLVYLQHQTTNTDSKNNCLPHFQDQGITDWTLYPKRGWGCSRGWNLCGP